LTVPEATNLSSDELCKHCVKKVRKMQIQVYLDKTSASSKEATSEEPAKKPVNTLRANILKRISAYEEEVARLSIRVGFILDVAAQLKMDLEYSDAS